MAKKKKSVKKNAVKKKSVRRAWTPADVRELKSLAKKKVGVAKISKMLKRTVGAPSSCIARASVCTTLFCMVPPYSGWG